MTNALIWGASGGMGQALCQQLQQAGWRVFAAARDLTQLPEGVNGRYAFNAADPNSIKDIAIDLAHQTQGLDLWVYAAGELQADRLKNMTSDAWLSVLHSNLTGAFLTASHTIQLLNDGAQAVFIGAYIDHLILPKMGAYAAAKAGLEPFVEILQKENRKINFTLVKPSAVNTPFWDNVPFRMPRDAKDPTIVAQAILRQQAEGKHGVLAL